MNVWDTEEASRTKAAREFAEAAGPCPNCGAPAQVAVIDITLTWGSPREYTPGLIHCSADCQEDDPDGYLAAINRRRDGDEAT